MAHLVVNDLAAALWEAISNNVSERDRPAFLDQIDGVSHSRTSNYDGLIAVADILKQDLDMQLSPWVLKLCLPLNILRLLMLSLQMR